MDITNPPNIALINLKQELQLKMETLQRQYEETKENYHSVVRTLHLLGYRDIANLTTLPLPDYSALKGLTQAQALEKIAKDNGGRFKMRDAKRIMVTAGLVRNPKNANNILHSTIQRTEKFKRVAPGEYELITKKEDKPLLVEAAHK